MEHPDVVNIGDSDLNADWIKTGKGHALEIEIHEALAEQLKEKGGAGSGHFGHGGRPGQRGGSAPRSVMPQAMVAGHITRTAAMKELGITQGPRLNALIKHGLPSIKEGNRRYIKWPEAKVWHETYVKNGKGRKGITAANKAIGSDKPPTIPKAPKPPKPPVVGEPEPPKKLVYARARGEGDVSGVPFKKFEGPSSSATKSKIRRDLSLLPQNHIDTVQEVRATTTSEWTRKYDQSWSTVAGVHSNAGKVSLVYDKYGYKKWRRTTVIHEAGHAVHGALSERFGYKTGVVAALGDYATRQSARQGMSIRYGEAKRGTRKFISDYSKTNSREYFAENYTNYVLHPTGLRTKDSEMYNFMRDNIFGGVEYSMAKPGTAGWAAAGGS